MGGALVPALYMALYASSLSPLVAIPFILGLATPVAGVVAAPPVALLLLYLDTPFIAYALAPALLLSLSRVFSSWRQVLVILLAPPLLLLYPKLAPLVLGAAIASFSSEDEVGAPLSGLIMMLNLYVAAALLLPGDVSLAGIIALPGGVISRINSISQIGMAGEFYVILLQKMQSSLALLSGLVVVPAAGLAASLVRERYGPGEAAVAATAVMALEALLLPDVLSGGLWGLIGFLASCGTLEVAASYIRGNKGEGKSTRDITPKPLRDATLEPLEESYMAVASAPTTHLVERDVLEMVMFDLRDLAATVKRIAARGAKIIVMGPRLEDEEMFIDYVYAGKTPPQVTPSRLLGGRWYENTKGYVAYITPLDPDEIVDIVEAYCKLHGVYLDSHVLEIVKSRVSGVSRYMVARLLEEIKARGCTREAVLGALGYIEQDIAPQFFVEFELVQRRLPMLGLKK